MAKILYVEDNEDNIYMLARRLKKRGHTIVVARNGRAGVQMTQSEMPDLVLMDLSMPEMDGWEATKLIKADARTRAIPVIALSSHAMPGDRERALAAGCDDYDSKPIDFTRLVQKAETLLSKRVSA
jgi:two-component system, cell cycle response regulator DivK